MESQKLLTEQVIIYLNLEERIGVFQMDQSCCCSVTHSCPTLCDSKDCARLPCRSPSPGACSHSSPLSRWCRLTILSFVIPFSSFLQSFPDHSLFPWVSSSHQVAKVLKLQFQHQSFQWIFRVDLFRMDWFDLAIQWPLKDFSSTTVQKHQFFSAQSSLWSSSHIQIWLWEK